jgi:diketogulonate reductase-like aldo/keto reductase
MPAATTPALTLNNGVAMPALGLGVFQTPPEETAAAVQAALSAGHRHIDTAAAYGNEHGIVAQAWSPIGGITFDRDSGGLDTGRRGGPDPDAITLETFGRDIPEA